MHIADMTMSYAFASGVVRTYLEAKHRRLQLYPGVQHSLLVPGRRHRFADGLYELPAPRLPFSAGQRFPLRRGPWSELLQAIRPDVIEAGDPYVTAWAALDAGQRLDVPVVGFYHSDLPLLARNRFGNWVVGRMSPYVARLYERFDRVLAPSQMMASRLHALGIERVYVQPMGVDLRIFRPGRRDPELRRQLGLSDDTRLLIYAGRGSCEKNVDVLLNTARRLGAPYHLLLVGFGLPRRVPDNVTVISRYCPPLELARLMASADAFVHAGSQESFGMVALEAMACGLPVVAAQAGALPEILPVHVARMCEPHNSASMAAAVQDLFDADVQLLGRLARGHVETHHAWDGVVAGLLAHYQSILGSVDLPVLIPGEAQRP
ncbi:glycosyltransferase [Stutzerimonas tarimensis]|uniref:Glycosyltransferase n=1 Tax=Stutzerimonas tarimensis TaxID=1507735 RepID=A0ABV7T9L9_9GAMM